MTDEIKVNASPISKGIFINVLGKGETGRDDQIRIQCNWCSSKANGSVFFEGTDTEHNDVDWLSAGIIHLMTYHTDQIV